MPLIPPSLRAPLIQGGAMIGSSLLGSKLAKSKPSLLEQQQLDRANRLGEKGEAASQNLFDLGMPAARQPIDYWSSILSGDRSKMTSAMGPELSRIGEGYRQAGQTSAALNPRGGPTPDFLAQQPYNQQRDISTMFQQARPQAAKELSGASSNLLTNAINALYSSTSAGRSILDYESQRRDRDRTAGEGIGKTIYDIFYPASGKDGLASTIGDIFKPKGGAATPPEIQDILNRPAPTLPMDIGRELPGNVVENLPGSIGTIAGLGGAGAGLGSTAAGAGLGAFGSSVPILPAGLTGVMAPVAAPAPALAAGAGGGSAMAGIGALMTNPVTIGVGAAIAAAIAWKKSQAHHEASTFVKQFQDPFVNDKGTGHLNKVVNEFNNAAQSGQLTREQATQIRTQVVDLINHFEQERKKFAQGGSDERKVAGQAKQTMDKHFGPNFSNLLSGMDQTISGLSA